jgi:hypothetical protein
MNLPKRLTSPLPAFCLITMVALLYALYTQHAWEDYYITYRSSRNLATGHGLVFNASDRLHTFTSPLGVLLPAVASLLTGNTSDPGALWIFRLMCITALGGAAGLLVNTARRLDYGGPAIFFVVAWLACDAKSVDFTINGMETAFMLLFLSYALWAHSGSGPRRWRHLGAAWAGLMWTRPDSFIYIALIAAGYWLFNRPEPGAPTRKEMLGLFLRAGAGAAALYLPWLLFAHLYYGTAVPHTITAKSGIGDPRTLAGLLRAATELPFNGWSDSASLKGTFLPAYYMIGGWPEKIAQVSGALATVCALLWLLPCLRAETRACSLAFFGAHAYLSYFPYFPFPWYLPSTTLLGLFALGGLLDQILTAAGRWQAAAPANPRPRRLTWAVLALAAVLLGGSGWLTWQTARQFQAQQRYIEEGTRRKIGEWLHANARPGDTVFMEPLGYIGFYSGLKTYDFPGMSSREMVQTRRLVGNDWLSILYYLQPTWLVLRPHEATRLQRQDAALLSDNYRPVQDFSVGEEIRRLSVYGRLFLEHDAHFIVYRLEHPIMRKTKFAEIRSQFDVATRNIEGRELTLVHAPGFMAVKVPPAAKHFEISYGFPPDAYSGTEPWTDGATFQIDWEGDGVVKSLLNTVIDPVNNPAHRGLQQFKVDLPAARTPGARLVFRTLPGQTTTKDWTCWSQPAFDKVQ